MGKINLKPEKRARVVELALRGFTYEQIAQQTGLSNSTIALYLKEARELADQRVKDLVSTAAAEVLDHAISHMREEAERYHRGETKSRDYTAAIKTASDVIHRLTKRTGVNTMNIGQIQIAFGNLSAQKPVVDGEYVVEEVLGLKEPDDIKEA